jgi:DMSO/TMAO reductase YedYZ molybdopterin-dependent catalytic subunit
MNAKATAVTTRTSRRRTRFWWLAAVVGVVSAAALLAVAEVAALLVGRGGSPVLAVGSFVVDIVPRWAKEFAIETFGGNDKLFLLASIGVAVIVAAAVAGVLEFIRPPLGIVVLALAGALSIAAIVTRAGATPLASLPTIVGTLVGIVLLRLMMGRLRRWMATGDRAVEQQAEENTAADRAAPPANAVERRSFLIMTAAVAAASAVVGIGARAVSAATSSLQGVREALKLPTPGSTVKVPTGAELDIPGLTPLFTPNADFYRVDTALTVPSIDPANWSLTVGGMVDHDVTLSFQDLVDLGVDEYAITLTCVSNEVGGELVGNARWLGVPIRSVLAKAGVKPGADMVLSRSIDGYTAGTPLSALTDAGRDAIFAIGMNGEALPFEHGFPVRMVVPGLYGYVSATKWLTELKVTTFEADQAYWTPRGYAAQAPIKMSSRIDTPRLDKQIDAGPTKIAGVAWAQTVGIAKVEVSIVDGPWQPATLATAINEDTWVQWYVDWEATSGTHYVAVRATDKQGNLQIKERAPIAPDGSSGWQRTLVRVK